MAKVLVVDDDNQMRLFLRRALQSAGHDVAEAENGVSGLQRFRERQADLVVTDIIMPEKEGIETLLEIKRDYPQTKVIGISGGGRTENLEFLQIARRLGADSVMAKPFRASELVRVVARLLADAELGDAAPRVGAATDPARAAA